MLVNDLEITSTTDHTAPQVVRVSVAGDLDAAAVPRLRAALASALHPRPARLELDLADVTFCSSGAVVELHAAERSLPGRVLITSTSRPVRRLLSLCSLTESFGVPNRAA